MNMKKQAVWIISLFFMVNLAYAATVNPVNMLNGIAKRMTTQLKRNKATLKNNPSKVYSIVRRELLPYVNVNSMSRSVVGRPAWSSANKSQQSQFTKLFTNMVIGTYANALASYDNEVIKFLPLRGGYSNRATVQVKSLIVQRGGPSIPVNYRLARSGSRWKIYDINVDGISMVQSYRSQFSSQLSQGGLPSLINRMKKR